MRNLNQPAAGSRTERRACSVSPSFPGGVAAAWESERARRLHHVCQRLDAQFAPGRRGIGKIWRREARRLDGKPFRTAPGRRWQMSASRLRNLFYIWRRRGRTASVFSIRWDRCGRPLVTGDFIRALAIQCSAPGVASIRAGYARLAARRAAKGGRMPVTYCTARRYMPLALLREVQQCRRRAADAEQDLARALARFQAGALALVPPRRTRERPLNFEI